MRIGVSILSIRNADERFSQVRNPFPNGGAPLIASKVGREDHGVKVIAAGPEVPITKYASQLVANLAHQPGYPADFAARVADNTVSREDNVRAILAKVALGEGDATACASVSSRTCKTKNPLPARAWAEKAVAQGPSIQNLSSYHP